MRKTVQFIGEDGRDKGKVFLLTEMSAKQGEEWAYRALLALMQSGADIPEGFQFLGVAALASMGMKVLTGLKWEVAQPLLEEMFQGLKIIPDIKRLTIIRDVIEEEIEEITTRVKLRGAIFKLNTDFLEAVAPFLKEKFAAAAKLSTTATSQK